MLRDRPLFGHTANLPSHVLKYEVSFREPKKKKKPGDCVVCGGRGDGEGIPFKDWPNLKNTFTCMLHLKRTYCPRGFNA